MKGIFLTKYGDSHTSYEIKEVQKPEPSDDQVVVKIEAFGLNFADVLARRGLYREAPPVPYIMGYDFVGRVEKCGSNADQALLGKRVTGMSRFGSYAEYTATHHLGLIEIPETMPAGEACALGVQYTTAYYSACVATNIYEGENILIHAASGGVGTALVQIAKWKGCKIFATAGSDEKIAALKEAGVHCAVNYRKDDYFEKFKKELNGDRMDVSFNAIAGSTFKKDLQLLGSAGRLILYGAAERSGKKGGKLATLRLLQRMGLIMPILLMAKSRSIIGVNLLKIADHKPIHVKRVLEELAELHSQGIIAPKVGGVYPVEDLAKAHELLENRKTQGKVIMTW